jgi:hypothetical protein
MMGDVFLMLCVDHALQLLLLHALQGKQLTYSSSASGYNPVKIDGSSVRAEISHKIVTVNKTVTRKPVLQIRCVSAVLGCWEGLQRDFESALQTVQKHAVSKPKPPLQWPCLAACSQLQYQWRAAAGQKSLIKQGQLDSQHDRYAA